MSFKVTIDFKGGPSLTLDIFAISEDAAKEAAKAEAPLHGFDAPIKKMTVRAA